MAKKNRVYSVFHAMDDAGQFDNNPANPSAGPVYKKQQFPRMVWHPEGKERVTKPAEEVETKSGYKLVGEQREIIYRVANNRREYDRLLLDGWHAHPAGALRAAGHEPPPVSAAEQIDDLQSQIAALQSRLRDAKEYDAATEGSHKIRHHNPQADLDDPDQGLGDEDDLPDDVMEQLNAREDDDAPDIDPHAGGAAQTAEPAVATAITPAIRRSRAAAVLTNSAEE